MTEKKIYELLNAALGNVSGDAFKVLHYIAVKFLNKSITSVRLSRVDIALGVGLWDDTETEDTKEKRRIYRKNLKQLDKITSFTNQLINKGYLEKDGIYYSIPEDYPSPSNPCFFLRVQ